MKDIDNFVEEITGVASLREEIKTIDSINHAQIKAMRDPQFDSKVSATLA